MSGLAIAPSLHTSTSINTYSPLLLTDASQQPKTEAVNPATEQPRAIPLQSPVWNGSYAHIQAQLLSGEMHRSFRRPTVNSPREAARAYGQTRRRPQTVDQLPRLQSVV